MRIGRIRYGSVTWVVLATALLAQDAAEVSRLYTKEGYEQLSQNPEKAEESFQKAVQADGRNAMAWAGLGDAREKLKAISGAVEAWHRARELLQGDPQGSRILKEVLQKLERHDRGWKEVEDLSSKCVSDFLRLGKRLVEQQLYSSAVRAYQAALALDPNNSEAKEGLEKARLGRILGPSTRLWKGKGLEEWQFVGTETRPKVDAGHLLFDATSGQMIVHKSFRFETGTFTISFRIEKIQWSSQYPLCIKLGLMDRASSLLSENDKVLGLVAQNDGLSVLDASALEKDSWECIKRAKIPFKPEEGKEYTLRITLSEKEGRIHLFDGAELAIDRGAPRAWSPALNVQRGRIRVLSFDYTPLSGANGTPPEPK